jgi:hypothetical protein
VDFRRRRLLASLLLMRLQSERAHHAYPRFVTLKLSASRIRNQSRRRVVLTTLVRSSCFGASGPDIALSGPQAPETHRMILLLPFEASED